MDTPTAPTAPTPHQTTRTKILATMGPAVRDAGTLHKMFEAGVNVCRLNFSHGTLDEHLHQLRLIREAAARHHTPVAVLGDLAGPKIRLGEVADVDDGGVRVEAGQSLTLQRDPIEATDLRVSIGGSNVGDADVLGDIAVGHRVLIEDGLLRFMCVAVADGEVTLNCTAGGVLKSRKGVNLPDSPVKLPSITDRDWECVGWAIDNELDFLALSFVRSAADIERLREHLTYERAAIDVVAKIEKPEAVRDFDAIAAASDAVMVARGDLGVEMDVAKVPVIQKDLIRRCQRLGKPAIVATQMLQSMIESSSPTRAEVSDVANAVFDGADAVMLSGETSVGRFPVGTVLQMDRVCAEVETYLDTHPSDVAAVPRPEVRSMRLSSAVASSLAGLVRELSPRLVVVYSQAGDTARIVSKHRLTVPVVALSTNHRVLRQMALHYGTVPVELPPPSSLRQLVADADKLLVDRGLAREGDRVLLVAGNSMGAPGTLNGIVIHTVGQPVDLDPSVG